MRSGFGRWILEHRAARIAFVAAPAALIWPLTGLVSAPFVAAAAISKGWREALIDCALALPVVLLVLVAGRVYSPQLVGYIVSIWFVAIALGAVTRGYGSLTFTVQAALVCALLGVTAFFVAVDDPVAYWERELTATSALLAEMDVQVGQPGDLLLFAPLMTNVLAVSLVAQALVAVIIGAWWSGGSGGPPFREMFANIRLGYILGGVAVVAGCATLLAPQYEFETYLLVLGVGFVFQGLSVVHWLLAANGLPWIYLIPVYLPFVFGGWLMFIVLFLLATVGFIDNWYGLRRAGTKVR